MGADVIPTEAIPLVTGTGGCTPVLVVIGTVGALVEINVAITADDTEVVSAGNVAVHPPRKKSSAMGSKEGVVSTGQGCGRQREVYCWLEDGCTGI